MKKNENFDKTAFCDIFTISKIALRGRMLVQNYLFFTILSPQIYDLIDFNFGTLITLERLFLRFKVI